MRYFITVIVVLILSGCAGHIEYGEEKRVSILAKPPILEAYNKGDEDANGEIFSLDNQPSLSKEKEYTKESLESLPNFEDSNLNKFKISANVKSEPKIIVRGKNLKVNIESIPLNEFIDFIFSSVLKMNYSVDKEVKKLNQPVNLNMSELLPAQQLFNVVEKILKKESVLLHKENGVVFLKKTSSNIVQNDLADKYILFGRKIPANIADDKKLMVFVPYFYMNPKSSFKILKRLGVGNVYFSYIKGNIQIIEGEASEVRKTLEMISVLDTISIQKKTPYLINLENIEVEKFKEELVKILKSNAIPIANTMSEVGVVLNPIKEINALLVLTPKKSWLDQIMFWKDKLDVLVANASGASSKLYMYKVKNRKADEFATILLSILSQSDGPSSRNDFNSTESIELDAQVNIKADLHTNSLLIYATFEKYKTILPIIKELDRLPLQVLIEVTLAEVDITNNFNLGFEWTLLNNKALAGTSLNDGAHSLAFGGAGITSSLFTKNLTSIINAYAEDKVLDILSKPSLLVLNNKTGSINVGQQVPTVSSEASNADLQAGGGTPSILRNISYINTGITLNLTPTINSNGTLTLDTQITLSEAQANKTSSIDSPLIINRQLSTSLVMHSGDTVMLGGLISHNKSKGAGGVPILRDIPYLGTLFKSKSYSRIKTELIILIKPKIIKNRFEINEATYNYKILLKSLKNL